MPHVKARSVNSLPDLVQTFKTVASTIQDPPASFQLCPDHKQATEKDYCKHTNHHHENSLEPRRELHKHHRQLELRESNSEMLHSSRGDGYFTSKLRRHKDSEKPQQSFPNEDHRAENDSLNDVWAHSTSRTNKENIVQAAHREVHNSNNNIGVDQKAGNNKETQYRDYYLSRKNSQNYVRKIKQPGIDDQRNVREDVDRLSENSRTHSTGDEYYLENYRPTYVTSGQPLGNNKDNRTSTDADRHSGANHHTYIRTCNQSRNSNQTYVDADHLLWNNNRAHIRTSRLPEPTGAAEPPSRDLSPQPHSRYPHVTTEESHSKHQLGYLNSRPPQYIYQTEDDFLVEDTPPPVGAGWNPHIRRYKLLNFPHEEGKNYKFNSSLSENFDLGDNKTYYFIQDQDRYGSRYRRQLLRPLPKSDETNLWERRNRIARSRSHDVASSRSHDVASSRSHDVASSRFHDVARSRSHDVPSSRFHDVARSRSHDVASSSRVSLDQAFFYPMRSGESHGNFGGRKEHFVANPNHSLNQHRDEDGDSLRDTKTDAVSFGSKSGGAYSCNDTSEEHLHFKQMNSPVRCKHNYRYNMKCEESLSEKKSFRKPNVREDRANMATAKRETRVADMNSVCSDTDSTDSLRSVTSSSSCCSGSIVEAEPLKPERRHKATNKKIDNSRDPTASNPRKSKRKEKKASEPHKSGYLLKSPTENNHEHTRFDGTFNYNAMKPSVTTEVRPPNLFTSVTSAFPLAGMPQNCDLHSVGIQSSLPSLQTEYVYPCPDYHFNLPKSCLTSNALNSPLLSSLLESRPGLPPFDFSSPLSSPYSNPVVQPVLYTNQLFQSLPLSSPIVSPFSLNSPVISYFSLSSPLLSSFPLHPTQQQANTTYSDNDTPQSLEHNTSASVIKPGQGFASFPPRTASNSIDLSEPIDLNQKPKLLKIKHEEKETSDLDAMSELKANSYRDQSTSPDVGNSLLRDVDIIQSEIDLFQTVSRQNSDHTHGNSPDAIYDIQADYVGSQSHLLCQECSDAFFTHLASFNNDNRVQNIDHLSEQMSSLNTTTNMGCGSKGQQLQSTQCQNKEQVPLEESERIAPTVDLNPNEFYDGGSLSPPSPTASGQTGCTSFDASDQCEYLFEPNPISAYFLVSHVREIIHDGEDTGRVCEDPRWMDTDNVWHEDKLSVTQVCSPSRPHPPSTPIPDADYDVYPRKQHGSTGQDLPVEDYSDT